MLAKRFLFITVAVVGCSSEGAPADSDPVPLVGFCAGGDAPSATGTALINRAPSSFRNECLNGVYENKGATSGGDFYLNTYVSRMEIRETTALAAIRCTFSGPLSNPPETSGDRDVTATVSVPLKLHDWGIEFLDSANDEMKDPFYISKCATELLAARWPFCVRLPDSPGSAEPPEGETFCVHVDSNGLQSVTHAANGNASYQLVAKKIGD